MLNVSTCIGTSSSFRGLDSVGMNIWAIGICYGCTLGGPRAVGGLITNRDLGIKYGWALSAYQCKGRTHASEWIMTGRSLSRTVVQSFPGRPTRDNFSITRMWWCYKYWNAMQCRDSAPTSTPPSSLPPEYYRLCPTCANFDKGSSSGWTARRRLLE